MLWVPQTFGDWCWLLWKVATDRRVTADPPLRACNPVLPRLSPRHKPDAELAELIAKTRGTDLWRDIETSLAGFERMETQVKAGLVPAPGSDFYTAKLRFLRLKFDELKRSRSR